MTIYLVRRHDGTYVQWGFNWTPNMQDAQIYLKPGPAKSRVTKWARMHPEEPHPTLLAFTFTEADAHVMDLSEDTNKAVARIARRKLERERVHAQWEMDALTRRQQEIAARLAELKQHPL